MTEKLTDLSKYIYGTGRLGDESIAFEERVRMARAAMDSGVWFHTSHTYGNTLQVLRAAFDQDRAHVPPAIFKIGWDTLPQIREVIQQNLEPLGLQKMAIGQLCLGGPIAQELRSGGPCYQGFRQLKAEGLVERFVLEVWPWTSDVVIEALRAGYPDGIVDGITFYLNPMQRFVSNELWELIQERNWPVVAIRTVAGGPVHALRDSGKSAEYMQKRAVQVAPIYERSGCQNWTEFCTRFVFGLPQVRASIGATSRVDNMNEYIREAQAPAPLPAEIQQAIFDLQSKWSEEYDRFAAPWTM